MIPNLNNFVGKATSLIGTGLRGYSFVPTEKQKEGIYENLCQAHNLLCTKRFAQWPTKEACEVALAKKPFGIFDVVWGDNVVRRLVHVMLSAIRPGVSSSIYFIISKKIASLL
jgi:hypothetical protein